MGCWGEVGMLGCVEDGGRCAKNGDDDAKGWVLSENCVL